MAKGGVFTQVPNVWQQQQESGTRLALAVVAVTDALFQQQQHTWNCTGCLLLVPSTGLAGTGAAAGAGAAFAGAAGGLTAGAETGAATGRETGAATGAGAA